MLKASLFSSPPVPLLTKEPCQKDALQQTEQRRGRKRRGGSFEKKRPSTHERVRQKETYSLGRPRGTNVRNGSLVFVTLFCVFPGVWGEKEGKAHLRKKTVGE